MGLTGFDFAAPDLERRFKIHARAWARSAGLPLFDPDRVWNLARKGDDRGRVVVLDVCKHLDAYSHAKHSVKELNEAEIPLTRPTSWIRAVASVRPVVTVFCGHNGCSRRIAAAWPVVDGDPIFAIRIIDPEIGVIRREAARPGYVETENSALAARGWRPSWRVVGGLWEEGGALSSASDSCRSTHVVGGTEQQLRERYGDEFDTNWLLGGRVDRLEAGPCRNGCGLRVFSLDRFVGAFSSGNDLESEPASEFSVEELNEIYRLWQERVSCESA